MTVSTLYAPSEVRRSKLRLKAYIETTNNLKGYVDDLAIAQVDAAVFEWGSMSEAELIDAVNRDASGGLAL
jgi:3'-phosphoadenosine 5'-phosphosulfate sulfotransferase